MILFSLIPFLLQSLHARLSHEELIYLQLIEQTHMGVPLKDLGRYLKRVLKHGLKGVEKSMFIPVVINKF